MPRRKTSCPQPLHSLHSDAELFAAEFGELAHALCNNTQNVDWDDVRYFLELARSGSLSGASRALAVEHTTIARRVSSLEASLGVRLFNRLPRGWRLTEEGRSLLPAAETLESSAAQFERSAVGASSIAGSVRLSAAPVVATHFLVQRLSALGETHPEIALELTADRRAVNLLQGEADIALRVGPLELSPGLISRRLARVGYGLYGTANMLTRPAKQQHFLGFDDSMKGSTQKQWLDHYAGTRKVALRSNDLQVLYEAAKQGLGLALLPHFMLKQKDALARIDPSSGLERPLFALTHPDVRRSPRVAAVLRFLQQLFRDAEPLLLGNHPIATS